MENRYTPEIRFVGFTKEWKERSLDSIVDRVKSYSLSRDVETSEYTGYKYIHYGDIHTKVADVINESSNLPNIKPGNYELLEKGDLVLADASEDYQGIATPAVITIDVPYKLVSGLHTIALRPKQVDSLFLYYLINSPTFKKYGYKTGTGMKVFGISVTNLMKFEGMFPLLEEQTVIGNFFKKIDDTIALHQQELTILKQTKKGFLQKMFPKEGESVPEFRFPGFTGDWEQSKLNEVAEIIGGGTPSTDVKEYWDGNIDWYSPVEIGKETYAYGSRRKITVLGLKKSSAKVLPANKTILFTSRAGIGDMAILKKDGATNQGFQSLVVNNNYDIYFVYSIGYKIKEFALKHASGSTFLEISGKILGQMNLFVPSLQEQAKIGNFFKQLDETIVLHQRELNALKETKKAFLQKMFA